MPIRAFLDGQSTFDAETIQIMSQALADTLTALGLVGKSDDLTIIVALKIIELLVPGIATPAEAREMLGLVAARSTMKAAV